MKSSESIGSKDDLVIVLNQEVEHVRDENDECIRWTVYKCPWDRVARFARVTSGRRGMSTVARGVVGGGTLNRHGDIWALRKRKL